MCNMNGDDKACKKGSETTEKEMVSFRDISRKQVCQFSRDFKNKISLKIVGRSGSIHNLAKVFLF